jgi:hypothetical protein
MRSSAVVVGQTRTRNEQVVYVIFFEHTPKQWGSNPIEDFAADYPNLGPTERGITLSGSKHDSERLSGLPGRKIVPFDELKM